MAIKTYKKGDTTKLSANFRAREFDCKCSGKCNETKIDEQLVVFLQKIREHFGKPVDITSGYRCAEHNKAVGGTSGSLHTKGQAADFVIDGVDPYDIAKYAESIGVKGIGHYDDFVHIDTRTQKSFWYSHDQVYRDSFWGYTCKQFVLEVQTAVGARSDGIAGPETLSKTPTVSRWRNRKHPVVKAVQKRLCALGYTQVGRADGVAGRQFDTALRKFQKGHGCVPDGEITAGNKTWRMLLGMEG